MIPLGGAETEICGMEGYGSNLERDRNFCRYNRFFFFTYISTPTMV